MIHISSFEIEKGLQKKSLSHHDNIKFIGLSYKDYLITFKVSCPSVVLITFKCDDTTLSVMIIITTAFEYKYSETCIVLLLNFIQTSNHFWINSDVL